MDPAGAAPTLRIGTVTTSVPDSAAAADITGTAPNFILNLTIPQGPTGPAGSNKEGGYSEHEAEIEDNEE